MAARDVPDGLTVFRVPRSHWHCRLLTFDWDAVQPKSLHERVVNFFHEVVDGGAPHMLLTGRPGIGKSHIGVGLYRSMAATLGTEQCIWLNVPAFCSMVKRSYGPDEADPWVEYAQARRLVVLDDLFGRPFTDHEKDQIITRLLDIAYQNNAAVLCTMNPGHEELPSRLPGHEVSRLLAKCTILPMTSTTDWRRKL